MNHHTREHPQLLVEPFEGQRVADTFQTEVAIAEAQAAGGGTEDADADRPGAMPEQGNALDEAKGVAAIMPTGKVGPVSTGARPIPTLGKNEIRRLLLMQVSGRYST